MIAYNFVQIKSYTMEQIIYTDWSLVPYVLCLLWLLNLPGEQDS